MVFVRVASTLCMVPAAVKDWEANVWSENFRRLDIISNDLKALFDRVDAITGAVGTDSSLITSSLRKFMTQKIALDIDITGLRSERVETNSLENMFVEPEIYVYDPDREGSPEKIGNLDDYRGVLLKRGAKNVLIGAPGSGKSTWAKWLQYMLLSESWHAIPIRVEMRTLDFDALPSVASLLKSSVGTNFSERIDSVYVNTLIEAGDIILLFDGLDEISLSQRDRVVQWIDECTLYCDNCSVLVTSRPLTTHHLELLSEFVYCRIQAFDLRRVVSYMGKWYKFASLLPNTDRPEVEELAEQWLNDPTLGPLTGNPLLLTTLLTVHHLDGSLPAGRSELYDRYVKGMLGIWDDRRKVLPGQTILSLEKRRHILTDLALEMLLGEDDQIEEGAAIKVVKRALVELRESVDPELVLSNLRERSGLIIGPGIYSFSHKTIGEFLVAQSVINGDRRLGEGMELDTFALYDKTEDDRWNTVVFL